MSTQTNFETSSTDWDKTASSYASMDTTKGPIHIPIDRMIHILNTHSPLSTATSILDIGCGPGAAISHLITTFPDSINPDAQILASDFSSGMVLQTANLRAKKLQSLTPSPERDLWSRMTLLVLDAMNLSALPSNSISHAMASFVLFMVPDPAKALGETHRVLCDDGVFACSSWSANISWLSLINTAAILVFESLGHRVPPTMPTMPPQWQTPNGVEELFNRAGFRHVKAEYVETAMKVAEPQLWTETFIKSGNPAVEWATKLLDEQGVGLLKRRFEKVMREGCEVDGEGAYVLPGVAVVVVGRK